MQLSLADYAIHEPHDLQTPALLLYPDFVDANIRATLRALGGDPERWRPHVKTAKLGYVMAKYVAAGVKQCKCSTTREVRVACEAGLTDVLLAYPVMGGNARRLLELADRFPAARLSVLVENLAQARQWAGSPVAIFIDVNPGMNRTGIGQERVDEVVALARSLAGLGLALGGLHYYDGHLRMDPLEERCRVAHRGYDQLLGIVTAVEAAGVPVREVVTSGTPAFPCAASYWPFSGGTFVHRVSPGTVVYNDTSSLAQLPPELGYRPAVLVLATVVSQPKPGIVTCDAGHKAVSADEGVPTCAVLGRPDLAPRKPSEEHLPIEVPAGAPVPPPGSLLYLIPRHVCPTVNNFDEALLVAGGRIAGLEPVSARGHDAPAAALV
jgi:D-serine deaminase-like pyridoxal phosphate-dependent protein